MGIPVTELQMSQEYFVEGDRFILEGFGRRQFLESCDVTVPDDIGQDETCVVCRRPGVDGSVVHRAADFAAAAMPCQPRSEHA